VEVKEIHKKKINKGDPVKTEEMVKKMRKEHEKLQKGMFEFIDAQGGWLEFSYRFFKDDPLMTIKITHGEICDLPMGIIKHLNNCVKKVRTLMPMQGNEQNARGIPQTVTKFSRMRFTPVDMM